MNISSTAAIVAAAAGIPVVKHGNRAASSASGSSDVLSELGINLNLSNTEVADVLNETGITFAYAAAFHPGFRHVAEARRELGVPTIFNVLGPLCNPARPEASAVGVAQLDRVPLITGVFRTRDATALVFRGDDGLDELTTTGHSHIWAKLLNTTWILLIWALLEQVWKISAGENPLTTHRYLRTLSRENEGLSGTLFCSMQLLVLLLMTLLKIHHRSFDQLLSVCLKSLSSLQNLSIPEGPHFSLRSG